MPPQKRMECFRLLFDHLAWIEHQCQRNVCPRYFPSTPGDFGGSFNISYHFNYCPANPGFGASVGVWCEIRPICSRRPLFQHWFSLPLFLLTEEGATSALEFWPIISLFSSFPWSGDSLGLLSLWPSHRVQTSVGFHSNLGSLLEKLT